MEAKICPCCGSPTDKFDELLAILRETLMNWEIAEEVRKARATPVEVWMATLHSHYGMAYYPRETW